MSEPLYPRHASQSLFGATIPPLCERAPYQPREELSLPPIAPVDAKDERIRQLEEHNATLQEDVAELVGLLKECARTIPGLVDIALESEEWILADVCEAAYAFRAACGRLGLASSVTDTAGHFRRSLEKMERQERPYLGGAK